MSPKWVLGNRNQYNPIDYASYLFAGSVFFFLSHLYGGSGVSRSDGWPSDGHSMFDPEFNASLTF